MNNSTSKLLDRLDATAVSCTKRTTDLKWQLSPRATLAESLSAVDKLNRERVQNEVD